MTADHAADRSPWHADDDDLRRLADGPVDVVLAASLEAHVMGCESCRDRMNLIAYDERVEDLWGRVRAAVEQPRPGAVERLLSRAGLSPESGRLLAAAASLRVGWLLGVLVAVTFAGSAAVVAEDVGLALFLLVAPLAPVVGVAGAFGGDADPSHEIVLATPYSQGRLLTLRTGAVLATSAPAAILVGLSLPGPPWLALAWLTPAAAGIAATLVLASAVGFTNAAGAVAAVWSVVCLTAGRAHDSLVLVGAAGQVVCVVVLVLCTAALLSGARPLDISGRLP